MDYYLGGVNYCQLGDVVVVNDYANQPNLIGHKGVIVDFGGEPLGSAFQIYLPRFDYWSKIIKKVFIEPRLIWLRRPHFNLAERIDIEIKKVIVRFVFQGSFGDETNQLEKLVPTHFPLIPGETDCFHRDCENSAWFTIWIKIEDLIYEVHACGNHAQYHGKHFNSKLILKESKPEEPPYPFCRQQKIIS